MWRPSGVDRATGLFIGLIVLSLTLVTVDLRASGTGIGSTMRDGFQTVFTPVQSFMGTATGPVVDFFESTSDLLSLRAENRRLRDEVAVLELQLRDTESLASRVGELEDILGVQPPADLETITARVLAVGVSEFDFLRVIDRGTAHGVFVDMPVVDEGGLIGRVIAVTSNSARVRLITDPTVRVAVRIERTGETGVVTGRGAGPLTLELFNTEAALVEGDLLVTADGRFPAGISVARVSRAARAEVGFTLRTEAAAAAALTRIDLVKVLVFTRDEAGTTDLEPADEAPVELPAVPAPPSEGGPEQVEGNQGTLAPGTP